METKAADATKPADVPASTGFDSGSSTGELIDYTKIPTELDAKFGKLDGARSRRLLFCFCLGCLNVPMCRGQCAAADDLEGGAAVVAPEAAEAVGVARVVDAVRAATETGAHSMLR